MIAMDLRYNFSNIWNSADEPFYSLSLRKRCYDACFIDMAVSHSPNMSWRSANDSSDVVVGKPAAFFAFGREARAPCLFELVDRFGERRLHYFQPFNGALKIQRLRRSGETETVAQIFDSHCVSLKSKLILVWRGASA